MSKRELDRAQLLLLVRERRRTQAQVAEQLGVSVRQVERLYRAYKAGGAPALVSRKRGRPSARRIPEVVQAGVLKLVRALYGDFGPTLAHEKLTELHGVVVSVETLRQWMVGDGLWLPRAQRRQRPHPPRYRRSCTGELVQIDGCNHEWFEDRGPRCVLLVYVDDATSRLMQLQFVESESTFDYFAATREYIRAHGKPVAFYSDKASTFRVNAKEPRCGPNATQFTRALGELNIDLLCANSPQAKGRVERANLTLQDRLVKELRLVGINNRDAANRFAPTFIEDFNRRFARAPGNPLDAHRRLRPDEDLEEVFRWKEERTMTQNLTVHYKQHLYVIEESPVALKLRGTRVQIHELADGSVVIRHGAHELKTTPFRKGGDVRQQDVVDNKYLASTLERVRKAQIANDVKRLKEAKMTKRQKGLLRASLAERATPEEVEAAENAASTPSVPEVQPANKYLGSVLERIKRPDWQDQMQRDWRPSPSTDEREERGERVREHDRAAPRRREIDEKARARLDVSEVLSEARQQTLASGLVFVPTLVRALGGMPSRDTVHRLLLDAHKNERLELQPESGLARLSEEELALCIRGPQDSHLSWARVLDP